VRARDTLIIFGIRECDISLCVESWGKPLYRLEPEWRSSVAGRKAGIKTRPAARVRVTRRPRGDMEWRIGRRRSGGPSAGLVG